MTQRRAVRRHTVRHLTVRSNAQRRVVRRHTVRHLTMLSCLALLGTLATMTSTVPRPAEAAPTVLPDQEVTFQSGGVTVHASVRVPSPGTTGIPAAVIIGGTGDLDRNGNSPLAPGVPLETYRWIADRLSAQGVASIRYDKLGTGATGLGPFAADPSALLGLTYDQLRVQPARDALALLARQPGVDPGRLLVIGHSEGGMVSLAIRHNPGNAPAPAGLALVEPQYGRILDILGRQITDDLQHGVQVGSIDPTDAADLSAWMHAGIDEIRTAVPPFPAPGPVPLPAATGLTAQIQSAIEGSVYGSDPTQMLLTQAMRTRYGKGDDEIDPPSLGRSVSVPTLITCGTKDTKTPCVPGGPPGSGVDALARSFPAGFADLVELPDTVHSLRNVGNANPTTPEELVTHPFSSELASALDAFAASFVPPPSTTTTLDTTVRAVSATPRFTG